MHPVVGGIGFWKFFSDFVSSLAFCVQTFTLGRVFVCLFVISELLFLQHSWTAFIIYCAFVFYCHNIVEKTGEN